MKKYGMAVIAATFLVLAGFGGPDVTSADDLRQPVLAAMRRAAEFCREQMASHGGYVYFHSLDLSQRWGEGKASKDQIWVQPPGTPTVGMAFLKAHRATQDEYYLDAAREAAEALVYGQITTGGWTNCIDFDPAGSRVAEYRNGKGRGRNTSSLDDGQTQSAIRFLVGVDAALGFEHQEIHESVRVALDALLEAQFPNGGFPQVWDDKPVDDQPILKANYPDHDWKTEGRIEDYWDMYTLNDGIPGHVAQALIDAHTVYGEDRFQEALTQLGDFLLLAQMPEPQPGWAQQYDYQMRPIWARAFEPPAIASDESQETLQTLMTIHRVTGDAKYLEPIPSALQWLKRSSLPDGRLARYYELRTNRPLYMYRRGKTYHLTHDDSELPKHYGWKIESRLAQIEREYNQLRAGGAAGSSNGPAPNLEMEVRRIIDTLDEQGRWISVYGGEPLVGQPKFPIGSKYLSSQTFSENLETLSRYLLAGAPPRPAPPSEKTLARGRKWTDATGRFSVQAELLDQDGTTVRLRDSDGKMISLPIERLSEADRRYLAARRQPPRPKPAQPKPAQPSGNGLALVKDGRPNALIVTNGRPKEGQSQAAIELQEHLRLMSGATLPIVKENELDAADSKVLILVGQSNLTGKHGLDMSKFELETFVIKTQENVLILAGDDGGSRSNPRFGTLWAVYDFLQDQLGVRWIWPGDIGRVVPRRETVEVADLDIRETPRIKVRGFRAVTQEKHKLAYEKEGLGQYFDFGQTYDRLSEDERVWLRRMRMGRSFKLSAGHAFTDWWEKYKDTDPEIFALQADGRRRPRKSSKPDFVKMCVSNPRLWELQLVSLRKYAKQGATGLWVNACENDGSGGFCTCARCREWDAGPNVDVKAMPAVEDGSDVDSDATQADPSELPESLSNRYARWYNELAKLAHRDDPEARVITYAYSRYRSPPSNIEKFEPGIWVGYVGFNAYPRTDEYRQMSMDEWFGWSRLGATVFLRSNSLFYYGEGAPYVVSRQIAEDFKFQVENGLQATDYDCLQGYWATTGPSYYVLARMLWDTEADPDEILNEFYAAFGPMEPVAREYFDYWEDLTTRLGNDPAFFGLNRTERLQAYPKFYTDAVLSRARAILGQGERLASEASQEERERFVNLQLGLEHGRLMVAALEDGKTSNGTEGRQLLQFRRNIASRNVVNVYWTTSKEKRYRVFE